MNISVRLSPLHGSSRKAAGRLTATPFTCAAILISLLTAQNIHAAGFVVAWGDSSHSQTNVPPGLTNAVAVAGGSFHSLALRDTGTVIGWGDDTSGESTPPATLSNVTAIAAGNGFSLGLQAYGSVAAWGSQSTVPAGLSNAVAISASQDNALALTVNGAVLAWGAVSNVPANVTNVVAIAAGNTHDLALKGDGTVVAWGDSSLGKTTVPPGLTDVIAIAAGAFHSLALKADGTVVAWGDDTYKQSSVPAGLKDVVAIAAGALHSLALKADGTVVAWGDNTYNQCAVPSALDGVVAIAAGRYHSLAIVGDGSPAITVQPVAQYNPVSGVASFRVRAIGELPLSYQWQQDGVAIPGATGADLVLNVSPSDTSFYTVVVSNSFGSVTSEKAALPPAWRQWPFVLVEPQDQTNLCNDRVTFQASAVGTEPLSYQWQFDGAPIPDATNATLVLDHATTVNAGGYALVVTNLYGAATSQVANLTVVEQPPLITSPLTVFGQQGRPFSYTITALHTPIWFSAVGLPAGVTVNVTNGTVQGTPVVSGTFDVVLSAANACSSATTNLTVTISSSVPIITSRLTATGTQQSVFMYQITATQSPTSFGAQGLPQGLSVNPTSGLIAGTPLYAGVYDATISASNSWGVGTADLHLTIANAPISGLSIANVVFTYSSPYLLDFQFSLRDNNDPTQGRALVVDPNLLSVTALEDDQPVGLLETAPIIQRTGSSGTTKVLKAYLILDFTESIASLANGDANSNGISDAVDFMVSGAQALVNQLPSDAQLGVYEFHRDDVAPQKVISLTTDKTQLDAAIGGIWTNDVKGFSSGSRCWDALAAAISSLGPTNSDEQHYIVFISDGRDESSTTTLDSVIASATNANVQIYCVGFGSEMDATNLQTITSMTQGQYYTATNATDLAAQLGQIGQDLSGQYVLRWATLKRSSTSFMPSFQVTYQGLTAFSPTNPPPYISGTNYVVDTNSTPPVTNAVPVYTTNYIIAPYTPTDYAGDPTVGSLRLLADADVHPSGVTLRATYVPRDIRQIQIHYRANWPVTVSLQSTNVGDMLYGWTLSQTNDGAGGDWVLLSGPNPQDELTSIPFASFGKLLTFSFRDVVSASNAFSLFAVDNSIYTNTGPQRFTIQNTNDFVTTYPALPYGTPVPWLLANGFTNNFAAAELSDPDGDGMLTWQEYQAGTDPRDPNSKFAILSVAPTGPYGLYQITFSTATNRIYQVETSADMVNWQTVQDGIQGTGGNVTVTDFRNLFGVTQDFYRVVVY